MCEVFLRRKPRGKNMVKSILHGVGNGLTTIKYSLTFFLSPKQPWTGQESFNVGRNASSEEGRSTSHELLTSLRFLSLLLNSRPDKSHKNIAQAAGSNKIWPEGRKQGQKLAQQQTTVTMDAGKQQRARQQTAVGAKSNDRQR